MMSGRKYRLGSIIGLTFLLMLSLHTYAEGENPEGKIKGTVLDSRMKEPVEFATVALYDVETNELITGSITDFLGHFKIEQPGAGEYYLIVSFIGFEEKKTERFYLDVDRKNLNLGKIIINPSANDLEEVEIVAKKSPIEYRIDKKVINVDKQLTSEAGTAVDILENVPSVQVDIEGNVTLRGSSGFTVLIDGKPTILDPSDALRQIPSSSIENIEIITNPSVKYEPDGTSGIINIVTKKNRLDGLSGIANANLGTYGEYGGDLQMNYRANKFNFIVGANYGKNPRPGYRTTERRTYSNDTTYYVTSEGDAERSFERWGLTGGVEYDLTKNDYISLSGRIGHWGMDVGSSLRYNDRTIPETSLFTYNSLEQTNRGGNYYSINGVYQRTFSKDSPEKSANESQAVMTRGMPAMHMLKIQADYQFRNIDETTTNELRSLSDDLIGGNKNVENGPSRLYRFNVDYTLPLRDNDKFEAGVQWRIGKSEDNTELWVYNDKSQELEKIDEYSNFTNYKRNIYAAYALYAGYIGDFGYQAGLRTEYTDRKIETLYADPFTINRWDYFPTLHLSYNLPSDQQVMVSYSKRINRPRGWYLEPFITWEDAYNVRQGNPGLLPEYIDSYEAGYMKSFNNNFFSFETYYRITNNKVERISSVYQDNVILRRPYNIGNDYSLGFEAMFSIGIFNWWDMEISGNYFRYWMKGEIDYENGQDVYTETIDRFSRNWNSRFNNTFRLWKNGEFQLSSRYNSESITAQGTRSGYYVLDAAFKVSLLNRSLSVNLQGRDLLGTALWEGISEGPDFYSYYQYEPKSPVVILTLTYKFNNFAANSRSGQAGGEGDEF
jgi:outer membrane receptor protein involved in Fe transport